MVKVTPTNEPTPTLTRRDFDEVMRRAAELAAAEPDGTEPTFTDAELLRIGQEVGLSERHVRQALVEFRTHRLDGTLSGGWTGGIRALMGQGLVVANRTVGRPRKAIVREIDEFMVAGQLLQTVRSKDSLLQYRPAIDWASRVARAASSTSRQHYVASARMVEVSLEATESAEGEDTDSTLVQIHVDPGIITNYQVGALLGGVLAGVVAGAATTLAVATVLPVALAAAAGVAVGGSLCFLVASVTGRSFRRRIRDVRLEVEAILDGLESGEGLEPPPPAWRRWVRRHFHGVAREMMGPSKH